MKLGLYLRNMGPQSTRESLLECVRAAEDLGLDEVWVADHIAIPPDDAEGSDGRYLDPLATLAFLAGATARIGLGTGVLVLPYRPALPTAKWLATIQELSGGRLLLGVGVGWMPAEFRAAGVDLARRGRITDERLEFIDRCFADDEVEANGQKFLFRPRPLRPPIFLGGAAPHAWRRAARWGDGWFPVGLSADLARPLVSEFQATVARAGRPPLEIVMGASLSLDDPSRAADEARAYAAAGVTRLVHGWRYADPSAFRRAAEVMCGAVRDAVVS